MNIDAAGRAARIAELNDKLRTTFTGGKVMLTHSVACLREYQRAQVLEAIRSIDEFDDDSNPNGERDFVSVEVNGERWFAKMDYYAPDMVHGSEDPTDPNKTVRVLTTDLQCDSVEPEQGVGAL